MARELHDGLGQLLAAMSMNVSHVMKEKEKLSSDTARCVTDNAGLIAQATAEVRTVSYLLHPPMLDEVGLQSALRWYTEGFTERSKINVALELDSNIGRLPEDYELSLFRVAQECLTNIHRHSGSSRALVRLTRTSKGIELEVKDEGGGMSEEAQSKIASGFSPGVGFRGMRERVKTLGGTLSVRSDKSGTSVLIELALPEDAATHVESESESAA
ncbi:MAG: sensor histidine kinase [Terriglobales bacterium]